MRTVFFVLFLLVNNGPASAYSCLPPELGYGGCNPQYFTLPEMEDTIHGLKGVTEEGKDFIFYKVLKKVEEKGVITIDLGLFSQDICEEGKNKGIEIFRNGKCLVGYLGYSLFPGGEINKSGSIRIRGNVNTNGEGTIEIEAGWDFP